MHAVLTRVEMTACFPLRFKGQFSNNGMNNGILELEGIQAALTINAES